MDQRYLKPNTIEQLTQQNIAVLAYTVNHASLAKEWFSLGVDAVFSDHPDLLEKKQQT